MGAIWFGGGEWAEALGVGAKVAVCYRPRLDEWEGNVRVRLQVEDVAVRGA